MALSAGTRLGPYEILAPLGAGGMGEVYRARDTRLERDVAIKVLPPGLQDDEGRRQRFEREARTVSQLNHPHICALHDVGHEGGRHYLVMELLEGESLAERLQKGPLPLSEVLRYGSQVAEALHAAHKRGITHRDLKPGNVVLTKAGAKLLDFGLAKAAQGASPIEGLSHVPTEARPLTEKGSILGTFQYMAPEQLEGLEADARTDIFALGALLYEMATGQRAFQGGSKTSLIAAIVSSQPAPVSTVVPASPAGLDHVIRKCLEKDPDARWQSALDVATELRWVGEAGDAGGEATGPSGRGPTRASALRLLAAALVGMVAGAAGLHLAGDRDGPDAGLPPLRFVIEHGDMGGEGPKLSTDGQRVAYVREGSVWVRDLRELKPVRVPDTEGAARPFWSPDGEWLGFSSEGRLWKIRLDGSGKTILCSKAPNSSGMSGGGAAWLPDGRIVFTTSASGLYEVPDRGGTARIVLEPGEGETDFHGVSALPDGRGLLFVVHAGESQDTIDLWTGTERRTLFRLPDQTLSDVGYAPTGHIVFSQMEAQVIWALPFSAERLEVTGEPLRVTASGGLPHTGANGTLAYVPTSILEVASQIVVVDRNGRVVRSVGEPRAGLGSSALSPDGRRLAVIVGSSSLAFDLWVYEMDGGEATQLTFLDAAFSGMPAWTPAGDEVVTHWGKPGASTLRAHRTDGRVPVRDLGPGLSFPVVFPSDGKTLLYSHFTGQTIELWKREYPGQTPGEVLLEGEGTMAFDLALSPDGRFIAYPQEGKLLVRSYPEMAGPWEVASGGAGGPVWDPRGERLYYVLGRDVMEVSVTTRPTLRFGVPRRLFEFDFAPAGVIHPRFAITPDGESFVMLQATEPIPAIVVIQNWLGLAE